MTKLNKRFIEILLSVVISIFTILLSVFVYIKVDNPNKENLNVFAAYEIDSYEDLVKFEEYVYNAEGETVNAKLTADIYCLDANQTRRVLYPIGSGDLSYYTGTFDGNGFTIYDYQINYMVSTDLGYGALGFFGYIKNATIKNLKLQDATYSCTGNYSHYFVGGVVGYAENSTIDNCYIEGLTFNAASATYTTACYIGGVAGYGGSIGNCYITNIDINSILNLRASATRVLFLSGVVYISDNMVNYCVFNPVGSLWYVKYLHQTTGNTSNLLVYNEGVNNFSPDGYNNDNITINPISDSNTGCYTSVPPSSPGYIYLPYKSSAGGKEAYNGYGDPCPWYVNANYDSWPHLRLFMQWKTYSVVLDNGEAGSLGSTTEFEIPRDSSYSLTAEEALQTSVTKWGAYIKVDITNTDYVFTGWTVDGTTITANTRLGFGYVTFSSAANSTSSATAEPYKVEEGVSITVSKDSTTLTFTFTQGGETVSVTYTFENKYYIKNEGITDYSVGAGETITISPEFELKKYNVTFS